MDAELLRGNPWDDPAFSVPPVVELVPSMLTHHEKRMLYWATTYAYEAQGLILDQGAFLGGSAMCFAAALRNRGFSSTLIHSYDRFRLGPFERERWFADGNRPPGDITRPLYDANLRGFHDLICVHEGDILCEDWRGEGVEILFVDIAKSARVWDHVVRTFFPSLLPGRSLLILQDYLYGTCGPWHHVVMEKLAGHFSIVGDTGVNSMIFQYHGGLGPGIIEAAAWDRIDPGEKIELMEKAVGRMDTEEKRTVLAGPSALLREELALAQPARDGASA
jgi:hypothetical protein